MAKERILIIEDEEDILELVSYNLGKEGYQVVRAMSGEEGLDAIRGAQPALVLLDLMLPGIDGLEVFRTLRDDLRTRAIPIIMLTAKSEETDVVTGLELGADDYITKPFSPRVLIARVRAVLRRQTTEQKSENAAISLQGLVIHPGRHEVVVDGTPVELTYTEFSILHLLAKRPGWVFSRYQIVDSVRGDDANVTERAVDVHIVGIRKKLGEAGKFLETVRGVGYRMKEP